MTGLIFQGRILYDVFLYSNAATDDKPGYLIEYDSRPSEAQPLLQMLKRHLLRSKIRLRDVTEEYDIWTAWSTDQLARDLDVGERRWDCHPTGVVEPYFEGSGSVLHRWGSWPGPFIDRRGVGLGQRIIARRGAKREQYRIIP